MDPTTLVIFLASNLAFLIAGYRMGRGMSPIPSAQPLWTNLKRAVGAEKPPEPPKKEEKPQPPLQLRKF
jgi:hypothetical protein